MEPIYEKTITQSNRAAAIKAFDSDPNKKEFFSTLLDYLIDCDRPEEARLVIDEPGQVDRHVLQTAFKKLSHTRAASWSFKMFADVVEKRPPLFGGESSGELGLQAISLTIVPTQATDLERTRQGLQHLIEVYGVAGTLASGETLLHMAARSAIHAIVQLLVDAGADKQALNRFGQTPFDLLCDSTWLSKVRPETLELLFAGRFPKLPTLAQFLKTQQYGVRPAAESVAVIKMLIQLGAKPDAYDDTSPLAAALQLALPTSERMKVVKTLADHKAYGATVDLGLAQMAGSADLPKLRDAVAFASAKAGQTYGAKGQTLLHLVCSELSPYHDDLDETEVAHQRAQVIKWLIDFGESLTAMDKKGKTPIDLARTRRKEFQAADWKQIEAVLTATTGGPPSGRRTLRHHFPDPAFALAVTGALFAEKLVKVSTLKGLIGDVDLDADEQDREAEAVAALHELEVPSEKLLERVGSLSFDVDQPIYQWLSKEIDADLGGESESLRPASIEGIAKLTTLKRLSLDMYGADVSDLSPLKNHPALQEIVFSGGHKLADAKVLLSIANLKRVVCPRPKAVLGATLVALEKKGVEVSESRSASAARKVTTKAEVGAVKKAGPVGEEDVASKKSVPKKSVPKKSVPKKSVPKKSAPKKSVPKKSVPKKSVPSGKKQSSPRRRPK